MDVKLCYKCQVEKPVEEFHRNKRTKDGRQTHCAECQRELHRQWREQNADKVRRYSREWARRNGQESRKNSDLRRRFGITLEQYKELHDSQAGKCGICGEAEVSGRQLAVDHDHSTGAIRALLCTTCNTGLGQFKDNPHLLRLAAAYLERN